MRLPQLSIIIVNWNAGDLLHRCVQSVANSQIPVDFEVLVVDNASTDNSLATLRESAVGQTLQAAKQLNIIENSENIGFGRANNQAFALTRSEFVFLLNPDAEVDPDSIQKLLEAIRSDSAIAACGPKILNPNRSTQTSVYYSPPQAWHTFAWQLKIYHLFPRKIRGELLLGRHWAHDRRRDVPMTIGAAMLVRRQVIDAIGGFDERFDMYAEDHEWCWRMQRAGWRVLFEPAATVVHYGGASAEKRWTIEERLGVRLAAAFKFEQLALSPWELIMNQLANYLVVNVQICARRITRSDMGNLILIKALHRKYLKRALKGRDVEPAGEAQRDQSA